MIRAGRSTPSGSPMRSAGLAALAVAALAGGAAAAPALTSVPIGSFENPVYVAVAPGYQKFLFVVERAGVVRLMRNERTAKRPFLDIRNLVLGVPDPGAGGEQGLLSIAFAPNYKKTRRFYVAYTDKNGDLQIDEFQRSRRRAAQAARKSRRAVLRIPHRDAQNHNGGQLQFGPDRLLYISTGDGGGGGDQFDNARRLDRLLGKLLRINPRQTRKRAYRIPKSNPFVGTAGRDEIFSYGLRNPWRFSFQGNSLLIADVGQSNWEEVDILAVSAARGANFGWPRYEGNVDFDTGRPGPHAPTFPVFVYDHSGGRCSITGGHVSDDPTIPWLAGRYLYADFCNGEIHSIATDGSDDQPTGLTLSGLASFGKGFGGQLYAVQLDGTVSRIEAP